MSGITVGIAVMAKASRPGLSKTRLCPPLTFDEAASFNTAFLQDVAANIGVAATAAKTQGLGIKGYMAFGPPGSEPFFHEILSDEIGLLESWHPHFGDCLLSAIAQQLDHGHTAAVVLNSDSPTLPTSLLLETVAVLARPGDRAVLGPSTDGGYYLLGLKRAHRRMFEEIDWSTERVARQTLERARDIGLSVHTLPAWYDVDDVQALQTLHGEICENMPFSTDLQSHHAARTETLLRSLIANAALLDRIPRAVAERAAE